MPLSSVTKALPSVPQDPAKVRMREPGELTVGKLEAVLHLLVRARWWNRVGIVRRPGDVNVSPAVDILRRCS
eukprot:4891164-Prorocentrum_lima.AAC.1